MLCQFSFKNFKSFKSETTLSFYASALPELKGSLKGTERNGKPLLPVNVIYGANGSGKTNLIEAIECMTSTVVVPIMENNRSMAPAILQKPMECMPFRFDETSSNLPTEFRLTFRLFQYEYTYFIERQNETIISEMLQRNNVTGGKFATVFDREYTHVGIGRYLKDENIRIPEVSASTPVLSLIANNYRNIVCLSLQCLLEACRIVYGSNLMPIQNVVLSDIKSNGTLMHKEEMLSVLNDLDIDISDYRYDEQLNQLVFCRTINHKQYETAFDDESEGTKKIFALLAVMLNTMRDGTLLVVDEFDTSLHPNLLKYIISLYRDEKINYRGAQLLFTAHNPSILKNDVFRRDEIWLVSKNTEHESELLRLSEWHADNGRPVNNTAAYDKQYLEGRYGAIPNIRDNFKK